MIKNILFLSSILFAFSCSCSKKTAKPENMSAIEKTEEEGQKKYGEKAKIKLNTSKDYALIVNKKKTRKNDPFPTVFFSVIEVKTNKFIYEDVIPGGQVKWISDDIIEIKSLINRPKDVHQKGPNLLYKLNVKNLNRFK